MKAGFRIAVSAFSGVRDASYSSQRRIGSTQDSPIALIFRPTHTL